jgi:hypothetical protein
MSKIKHQMIERREIDLAIPKEEVIKKLLATYQIENITGTLLSALRVAWKDECLLINGIEETVITDITPEYNDDISSIVKPPVFPHKHQLLRVFGTEIRIFDKIRNVVSIVTATAAAKSMNLNYLDVNGRKVPFFTVPSGLEKEIKQALTAVGVSEDKYSLCDPEKLYFLLHDLECFPSSWTSEWNISPKDNSSYLTRFAAESGSYFAIGQGGLQRQFGNVYFVTEEAHFANIPPNVEYGKKYKDGWKVQMMDGTTSGKLKKTEAVTSYLDFEQMLSYLGYTRVLVP